MITSTNPTTGRELARFEEATAEEVERALAAAAGARPAWRRTSPADRSSALQRVAAWLDAHAEECARTIALEMGKCIGEARAELAKCSRTCRYFAVEAAAMLAEQPRSTDASDSRVAFRPLGCVLAIMPWNFPFWQLFRFAAPALMAGNVALLKHASNVPACARLIERCFRESGLGPGVFQNLLLPGDRTEALIDDPRVAAVTITGSDAAGERVARRAGGALKKAVLELGGSDPFIVLRGADLERAAAAAARSRFQNAGQSCIAAKRFIVERPLHDAFVDALAAQAAAVRVGDPLDEGTAMGPLARADLRAALDDQVRRAAAAGAEVVLGGAPMEGPGWFYPPTLITGVTETSAVFVEETFGPVAAVTRADDTDHALALANATRYGLGAAVWTGDVELGRRCAAELEVGSVFVNGVVASDPRLPFGGVKRSGYGRELSEFGIREFTSVQTIWIGPARGE